MDCIPCDCDKTCGSMCGHSIDISEQDPIQICNRECNCDVNCPNRLSKSHVKFDVIHNKLKGWCLVARDTISKGTYIGDYTGEIISTCEAKLRHAVCSKNFILTVREKGGGWRMDTHVDARFLLAFCSLKSQT